MPRPLIVLSLFLAGSLGVRADSVVYTVAQVASGFQYCFETTNTGDTGGTLFDLFLSIPTEISNIQTATIGTPEGWGDPTGGFLFFGPDTPTTSFIEWASDASGLYDVQIGSSLAGFTLLSSQNLNQILFSLNGLNTFAVAQQTVPEPSVAFPFIIALLAIAVLRRKRILADVITLQSISYLSLRSARNMTPDQAKHPNHT
jgi:hypothetical protein